MIFAASCSNKMMGCNIKLKPERLQVSSAVELSRTCCDKEPADQSVLVKNIKLEKQREGLFLCLIIQEGRVGIVHFLTFHYGSPIVEEIPPTRPSTLFPLCPDRTIFLRVASRSRLLSAGYCITHGMDFPGRRSRL